MSSPSSTLWGSVLTAAAVLLCACDRNAPVHNHCEITPPAGPFDAPLNAAPAPPTIRALPDKAGASSVLLTPAPRHRWSAADGLVETRDGSLLLHGVARAPGAEPAQLHIVVLVGYEPVDARLTVWTPDRRTKITAVNGSHLDVQLDSPVVSFDLEFPAGTVPVGTWQELQTVVALGSAAPDVRRWTVVGGPKPPASVVCVDGGAGPTTPAGRSHLSATGELTVVAPRRTELAVVPIEFGRGPARKPWFVSLEKGDGWTMAQTAQTDIVAVFDGPFAGPQKNWISNFWSASRSKAVSSAKVR